MLCLEIPKEINHESFRHEHTGSLCTFRPRILSIGGTFMVGLLENSIDSTGNLP